MRTGVSNLLNINWVITTQNAWHEMKSSSLCASLLVSQRENTYLINRQEASPTPAFTVFPLLRFVFFFSVLIFNPFITPVSVPWQINSFFGTCASRVYDIVRTRISPHRCYVSFFMLLCSYDQEGTGDVFLLEYKRILDK